MDFQNKQYIFGIDLGTTNCAVSYVDVAGLKQAVADTAGKKQPDAVDKNQWIRVFQVPQLTGPGEFSKMPVLPSFLYIPGEYDVSKEGLRHPWKKREDLFAGMFARDHGAKIPSRLVSSAKSWLCHGGADRQARILPWGSTGIEKISPVNATAEYLLHIRSAWNHFVKDEDKFMENQFVVVTVPASFNEEARDLTMAAIEKSGLSRAVILLEEPLAAFYSWLIRHEADWDQQVGENDLILVCDVGGGTTDFSLISLKAGDQGAPRFERLAVGDHLILGGDNIDLTLAKIVEAKFKSGTSLTPDKWKTLCHQCRQAKEQILENREKSVRITLKGEGRALISGTLTADLTRGEVENLLRSRFYPDVDSAAIQEADTEREVADFGLPFEKEPAVTRHIIRFLEKHRDNVKQALGKEDPVPDFILFNGGTLKPSLVQSRIKEAVRRWFKAKDATRPVTLENDRPELAVGIGASYYGLVRQGIGVRVGSGSPRSYYLGVTTSSGSEKKAICLVERGLDEGSVIDLPQMSFEVRANEPVSFDLYSSSFRSGDTAGLILPIDDTMTSMPPIQTVIRFGKNRDKKTIPVALGAEYTEMGSLSMYCHSRVSDHRWKLQFQLRETEGKFRETADIEVYDQALIQAACRCLAELFSDPKAVNLASAAKQIEAQVEQARSNWPLSFLRSLADQLIALSDQRRLSPDHEARWLNLTGFCMRPGFGDAFDTDRIGKLWKVYLDGLVFDKAPQNRLEWWIFIRRIAAGLKAGHQRQFYQDTAPILIKQKIKLPPQETVELWMTAGNLERLLVKDKILLAKALIPQIRSGKNQDRLLWTLGRLGARDLLYGSVDRVVPSAEAARWVQQLMKRKWTRQDNVNFPVVQMALKTGDRTRDLDPELTQTIVRWLEDRQAEASLIKTVQEKTVREKAEQNLQFGEKLPSGLMLKKDSSD